MRPIPARKSFKSNASLHIGIFALGGRPGIGAGIGVYTQMLVEALAQYGVTHRYSVLVSRGLIDEWKGIKLPAHLKIQTIDDARPQDSAFKMTKWLAWRAFETLNSPRTNHVYLSRQINQLRLDVLHFPGTVIPPIPLDMTCILTFFDMQQEFYPEFFTSSELQRRKNLYRPSVERANHLFVPSNFTRESLIEKYNVPVSKITLCPVGLPNLCWRTSEEKKAQIRKKYNLPQNFIFYPANPWQHKNHARLFAALRIYQKRYGDLPWSVFSGRLPDEKRDIESLAIAASVEDKVIDIGLVPFEDLPAIYGLAKLMIFPSLFEGFGIPLIEAMASGCPIAAAEVTSIPEVTKGAALLFDPLNPEEITSAIRCLLTDDEYRQKLIGEGFKRVQHFQWSTIVRQLEAEYYRVFHEMKKKFLVNRKKLLN